MALDNFTNFVNDELPKRLSSSVDPLEVTPGQVWVSTGVGLGAEPVSPEELGGFGKSAYEIAVDFGFEGSEEQWLEFLKGEDGEPGPEGPEGKSGAGLVILGQLSSTNNLPMLQNRNGDCYIINSRMYVWAGNVWAEVSQIGPTGPQGPRGIQGIRGPRGERGPKGDRGERGLQGNLGPAGPQGDMGPGVEIIGRLDNSSELPSTGELGQGYLIDGNFWGWVGDMYMDLGPVQGPRGDIGPEGPQGPQGPEGPEGPEGPQGEEGPEGPQGPLGPTGPIGPEGPVGPTGPQGRGLQIDGVLPNPGTLPNDPEGEAAYLIDGELWVWGNGDWVNTGQVQGPKGDQGEQGPQGIEGPVGPRGETGERGDQGIQGPVGPIGPEGPQGAKGDMGPALTLLGKLTNPNQLPDTGNLGDGYLIDGEFWGWAGTAFENLGEVQGPQGEQGPQGPRGQQGVPGIEGPSAYQVALDSGFEGTRGEWLATLIGPEGPQGPAGVQGPEGPEGPRGIVGETGPKGDMGPGVTILGRFDTTSELPSTGELGDGYLIDGHFWGWDGQAYIDMGQVQGPKGDTGERGMIGPTGPQGPRGDVGPMGPQGIPGQRGIRGERGEKGLQGLTGPQGPEGPQGIVGPRGFDGPVGPMGPGVNILGKVNDVSSLPATGEPGDGYLIDGNFWGWTGEFYEDLGPVQGPAGPQGPRGIDGPRGPAGPEGPQGLKGDTGPEGPQGPMGTGLTYRGDLGGVSELPSEGVSNGDAYSIDHSLYIFNGESWINAGDLQGPSAYEIFLENNPSWPGNEQDWLQSLNGNRWIAFARDPTVLDGNVGDFFMNTNSNEWFMKIDFTTWVPGGYLGGGTVYEAPVDNEQYVRRDGQWQILEPVMPEAPIDDHQYVRFNGAWTRLVAEVEEAPDNGDEYVRRNKQWVKLVAEVENPPTSPANTEYVRSSTGNWNALVRADANDITPTTSEVGKLVTPKALVDFMRDELKIVWNEELGDWLNDQGQVSDLL